MQDSLLAAQIRAARALLGWSQAYLAKGIGVSRPTIVYLESARREPLPTTLAVLVKEFGAAGIVFTKRGVEFRKWPARPYVPIGIKQKIRPDPSEKKTGPPRTIKNLERTNTR